MFFCVWLISFRRSPPAPSIWLQMTESLPCCQKCYEHVFVVQRNGFYDSLIHESGRFTILTLFCPCVCPSFFHCNFFHVHNADSSFMSLLIPHVRKNT
ncbi:rCG44341 [Rattus norvegicus]|uniref:RCG44341 n=1 Tax=Rattus norvegicus TaxID=10116 RepID=A6KDB7_RAT|nr:rCG44341 [Rattus norvegicus]